MKLRKPEAMKDSGVEWLGSMPAHWWVARLATVFHEVSRPGCEDLPVLSISIHDGISDDELDASERDRKVTHIEDRSKYKRVASGDLAYNMMRAWQGGLGAVSVEGQVSPAYVVAEPIGPVNTRYIELLLRTPAAVEEMRRFSRGIADFRSRLYWEHFRDIKVCLPPIGEQDQIAAEVAALAARIDALIEKKSRFIELLREKRQALITHAVTKGLDPAVPMKDSSVEWLGQVPAHWHVGRFKHSGRFQTGTDHKGLPDGDVPVFGSSETPFASVGVSMAMGPAIAIGRKGTIDKPFMLEGEFWAVDTCMFNHIANPDYDIRYCYYFSTVVPWLDYSTKTALPSLTQSQVDNIPLPRPEIDEQRAIATHLDRATTRIDTLIAKSERSIELLREKRTALITAAVTGKIDLREAA